MAKEHWEKIWQDRAIDVAQDKQRLATETQTPRWRFMERLIKENLGSRDNLSAIEIGAGIGDLSILLNHHGLKTTLADYSPEAIKKARERFKAHGIKAEYVEADMLKVPSKLKGKFDVSFSLGLAEHFVGQERQDIINAHFSVLKPGGVSFISIPYRFSPTYRIWMRNLIKNDSWDYGLEVPFSKKEIQGLAEAAGFTTLGFTQSSFFSDWNNFFPRHRVGKLFRHKLEQDSLLNGLGYALVYAGRNGKTAV